MWGDAMQLKGAAAGESGDVLLYLVSINVTDNSSVDLTADSISAVISYVLCITCTVVVVLRLSLRYNATFTY